MDLPFIFNSKRWTLVWVHPSCTRKHKFKVKWSAGQVLTIIFWDSLVVLRWTVWNIGHPVNLNMSCRAEKLAIGQEKTSQSSKRWCGSPPWQYTAAHGTVDLELVANLYWEMQIYIGKYWTIPCTVWIWRPAMIICFMPWRHTCQDIISLWWRC